jgi:hypothetical protein
MYKYVYNITASSSFFQETACGKLTLPHHPPPVVPLLAPPAYELETKGTFTNNQSL